MTLPTDPAARRLIQMKRWALLLLGLAAVIYGVGTALQSRHVAWGYVAAFGEAAMVGAMADWFAVVALFRRPLNLPIPHTAIIPRNKNRIGGHLAGFICEHFLSTPQVLAKIVEWNPGLRIAAWLSQPQHADQLARHGVAALRYGLDALDDIRLREFIRRTVVARLQTIDLSHLAGEMLDLLTAERRHQALLDELLLQASQMLDDEVLQTRVAELVAEEVDYLRYVGLNHVAGKLAAKKIVAGLGRLIGEMGQDPNHALRLRFDDYTANFVERLKHDQLTKLKGESLRDSLLAHPALANALHGLWDDCRRWMQHDLADEANSQIRERLSSALLTLGQKLRDDAAMQAWVNEQLLAAAPPLIERYREDIRRHISDRVAEWNSEALSDELERHIGRDLQFVRINGTLVGGLIGVLIHAVTGWWTG